jgi:acyl-[acyl-carrier-protein]-phospholipid O-acyltransferase/long-chain-fatty-acid--[acyl-carrier-protein] ligase
MMAARKKSQNRSFFWLNTTQFLGALNDNLFKLLLIFFLINIQGTVDAGKISALAGAVFVIPFLVFSPLAGFFADRVAKSRVIVTAKVSEVLIMTLGAIALWISSPAMLYLALFLMALQSTFFSPAKYGIVPELVSKQNLSKANGMIEAFTYLAIILGTVAATMVPTVTGGNYRATGFILVIISVLGFAASTRINKTSPKARNSSNPVADMKHALKLVRKDRHLTMAVAGSSLFMLVGAFVQLNLIPLGIQEFGLTQEQSGALFLLAAFGIGSGSLLAGRLSGRNVELGVVPIGAMLLFGASTYVGVVTNSLVVTSIAIAVLGIGAGLFIVPLHSFIQFRAPELHRGKILAVMNFLGWFGVLVAAILTHLVNVAWGQPAHVGFIGLGALLAIITVIAVIVLPDFLMRFFALILMKFVYRVKVEGLENIPVEGGALLVANHVSWVDSFLLLSTQQRRIRFLMERDIYNSHRFRIFFRLMKTIPISSTDNRKQLIGSIKSARKALDDGYLVCIFAEGMLTRNGTLQAFRPGFKKIVKGTNHPVIPTHLGGIWGSIFSYKYGPMMSTIPKSLPGPVIISYGEALPTSTSANEVRQAVMELSGHYFDARKNPAHTISHRFIQSARRNWGKLAISDSTGQKLSYGKTLCVALLLNESLNNECNNQSSIGVLLPPSVAGSLANIAITVSGRVPVNLNYSVPQSNLASVIEQAEIHTVITSRKFLSKLGWEKLPANQVFIEDHLTPPDYRQVFKTWLKARCLPAGYLLNDQEKSSDDLATIIFSSGSTSEPKGVMLSHHNILSNVDALNMVFSVDGRDNACGILPFFHSFGFTGTLWFPLLSGFSVTYHPSPLDCKRIAKAVRDFQSTFLLATPTFLNSYLRKIDKDDFKSLRVVISGAEKLNNKLAQDFYSKFNIMPLEGYGATELSPVVAISLPDVSIANVTQTGSDPGSVGRPLPGVAVRIVDPESDQVLDPNIPGMIEIKGPNVMVGYLNQPELTDQTIRDGWYRTGDIGCFDHKGFLQITGRLSRFSKIGGEMIPHGAIEEVFFHAIESDETSIAVTSIADEKKGEKIVVLYLPSAGGVNKLRAVMDKCSLPNLWKPAADSYLQVDSIPLLGSGKLDLRKINELAKQQFFASRQKAS